LEQRGEVGYFVGYTGLTNAYRIFESNKRTVKSHRDIRFEENVFDYKRDGKENEPLTFAGGCNMTQNMGYMSPKMIENDPEFGKWKIAIEEEMRNINPHEVIKLVDRDQETKTLRSRWVLVKKTIDGDKKLKAHLVVDGSKQEKDVDVGDIYSPKINKDSLRIIIALSAQYGHWVYQMDVVTAFLHGEIDQLVHMELPHFAFDDVTRSAKVGRLGKALFGLCQSLKIWNQT
jgi:Reverse transcriptase (RNA-dependent DNA polymerase)